MRRRLLLVLLAVAGALALLAYLGDRTLRDLKRIAVTEDVTLLQGPLSGNAVVLRTGAGAVVVDTMLLRRQGQAIIDAAAEVAGEPVVLVVNTHYHLDHTHGNPAFADVPIIATERTLRHLRERDAEYWENAPAALPTQTFADAREISIGGKTIRLLRLGRGHTDGDLIALFVEDKVVHMGDLYFNRIYPNIDLEAGGSAQAWPETLDAALALPFDLVIPGHGDLSTRAELAAFRDFMAELAAAGREAAAAGWSREEMPQRARLTTDEGYETLGIPFVMTLDRDFVLDRAWEETARDEGANQ